MILSLKFLAFRYQGNYFRLKFMKTTTDITLLVLFSWHWKFERSEDLILAEKVIRMLPLFKRNEIRLLYGDRYASCENMYFLYLTRHTTEILADISGYQRQLGYWNAFTKNKNEDLPGWAAGVVNNSNKARIDLQNFLLYQIF